MIKLKIGSKLAEVDGLTVCLDVSPFVKSDRTFVPVRFIAETLGQPVDWDEGTQTVTIGEKTRYFGTADECAVDWAMRYNNLSIGLHRELASSIYKDGKGYYYTEPNTGTSNNSVPSVIGGKSRTAVIHSHASTGNGTQKADRLSSSDIAAANTWKCDNYAATPCGKLEVYRYGTRKCETVSLEIPYDRRAIKKLRGAWGYGDMRKNDEFFDGYNVGTVSVEADFYNKLFSEGRQFPIYEEG